MKFIVISLKKYLYTCLFLLFLICLIFYSENNLIATKNGLAIWVNNVIPSLFPFFIATELLYHTNFIYVLGKFLNKIIKPIFNVPGESSSALILGILSGYPVGAKIVCKLKKERIISKIEAERLIAYTNNSSPLFIIGTIGISLFHNKSLGFLLLFSHILSCLIVGFLFRFWKINSFDINYIESKFNSKNSPIKISELGDILSSSIISAINTTLLIGGFIVFFSIIISILENLGFIFIISKFISNIFNINSNIINSLLYGMLELTNGINKISQIYSSYPKFSILSISFILGFGGISILFQIFSIISKEKISIKPYLLGKTLQAFISCLITYFLI